MTTVHSLLAVYGTIDQLVVGAGPDSETAAIVERYLPGTTGANAGWFAEIAAFLDLPDGELPEFPTLHGAIEDLTGEQSSADSDTDSPELTPSEGSRLAFALAVLSLLPETEQIQSADILAGLKLVVPDTGISADEAAQALVDAFAERLGTRDDWPAVMNYAAGNDWIDDKVALVPLCRTRIKRAHGHTCVVLTTEFSRPAPQPGDKTSEVPSLEQLKAVVDPLNWHRCLSFFCDMRAQTDPKRPDGWRRVLEITSTTCKVANTPRMTTPLKYWAGPPNEQSDPYPPTVAWVNYELDDTPGSEKLGDGLVLVDEGYIKMEALNINPGAPGIRVQTKKVVAFRYLSEVAIAILACVAGYGNQGVDMLLGGVAKRAADEQNTHGQSGWTDWSPTKAEQTPTAAEQGGPTTGPPAGAPITDIGVPTDPTRPSRLAVVVAVDMATKCIDEFSARGAGVAAKWATGTPPIPETVALATEFAARLATDPWRYVERLREIRKGEK